MHKNVSKMRMKILPSLFIDVSIPSAKNMCSASEYMETNFEFVVPNIRFSLCSYFSATLLADINLRIKIV